MKRLKYDRRTAAAILLSALAVSISVMFIRVGYTSCRASGALFGMVVLLYGLAQIIFLALAWLTGAEGVERYARRGAFLFLGAFIILVLDAGVMAAMDWGIIAAASAMVWLTTYSIAWVVRNK